MRFLGIVWFCMLCVLQVACAQTWQEVLWQMPFPSNVTELNRTNCVDVILHAFQSNGLVKALVFMPGATDEFYLFRRAKASLSNSSPTLFDAVCALTNQTYIRATFYPPLLLLHTDEDPLEPLIKIEDPATVEKLKKIPFIPHALYNDRDWDTVQPVLKKTLKTDMQPWRYRFDSWHFYRHSFAGWGLTGWEALEAVSLAGKTKFTVARHKVVFEGDTRTRGQPHT